RRRRGRAGASSRSVLRARRSRANATPSCLPRCDAPVPRELRGTAECGLSRAAEDRTVSTILTPASQPASAAEQPSPTEAPVLAVDRHPQRTRTATVEIVVPVHNEEADLEASVRRLHAYLGDGFPLRWVVTIADNASTDRTWAVACRLADELD